MRSSRPVSGVCFPEPPTTDFRFTYSFGAPRGEKYFVFVNPPVVNHQLGIRRSYLSETRRVASEFLKRNLQLIVFAQSRLATELLQRLARTSGKR